MQFYSEPQKSSVFETGAKKGAFHETWGRDSYAIPIRGMLAPLLQRLRHYDDLRIKLERKGGVVIDFQRIATLLESPFTLNSHYGQKEVRLTDPGGVSSALWRLDDDIHLDVRQLHTRMPVYYICRIKRDYFGSYSLIVEDYYMSPGYPLTDERFINLMSMGHETFCLHLSQFREGAANIITEKEDGDDLVVDNFLHTLGREIFSAMWHEDQRLGVAVAKHFDLPLFRSAMETIYLCLSSDLCQLRAATTSDMIRFFHADGVYPQPFLSRFLTSLSDADGATLNELPQRALRLYKKLLHAFRAFLSTEVKWGRQNTMTPLWKLVYGNYFRLDVVSNVLKLDYLVGQARRNLETCSHDMMHELMEDKPKPKKVRRK